MADLVNFPGDDLVFVGRALRRVRDDEKLTLRQAAAALEVSPVTLDGWEQGRKTKFSPEEARALYKKYREDTNFCRLAGNNLLFGAFPIRVARDILGMSVDEISKAMGYSKSSWTKMEANARVLPNERAIQLESLVAEAWDAACETY